jgi:pyruvate,water dikinase
MIMGFLRNFKDIEKSDVSLAGGKGASLGEMTRAGIPVPPGFVILSTAFEKFLEETDLNVEIDAILHTVNHKEMHTVENASEKINYLILSKDIPQDIAKEIQKFFKGLNSKYVAVRSSATAEDSTNAAWAGQLESYLNTTEENLLENVKKCWASLFTPRAIFYRFEKDLHNQKISVAVVVQKMVQSEKSGIAFSVHPVTEDRNQLIIESGFGLGEAIVSGQITPDSYVVEKQPRRIIDTNIQTQSRGLYRAKGGSNEWHDIPKEQGEKQVLLDDEILELSEIILKIENHYNFPCDIEWAFESKNFYIVQSRPITTLTNKTL